MAPTGPHTTMPPLSSGFDDPFPPPLRRKATLPSPSLYAVAAAQDKPAKGVQIAARVDPCHLAPEDAFYSPASPPRRSSNPNMSGSEQLDPRPSRQSLRPASVGGSIARTTSGIGIGNRSRSRRRRKRAWKKLLWVKQSYPDNYTDQATFLENLQRNPRLQPYDFWPLVADSTVIVQHVCSVIIFIVCFVGIFQERVSPVSVVGWGSFATCLGWLLWERWASLEEDPDTDAEEERGAAILRPEQREPKEVKETKEAKEVERPLHIGSTACSSEALSRLALPPTSSGTASPWHQLSHSTSTASLASPSKAQPSLNHSLPPHRTLTPMRRGRARRRIATFKSGVLIYFTLLGLSPILKSLTRSTSSDSIWAMSFWLLAINIFFFDYSGAWVGAHKFPVASLSTNAALMASTVLASRLPSTGQVFSLTLFSIEVFGLFPVFRRYARHHSWRYHVSLTVLLMLGAGAGVGIIMAAGSNEGWPWRRALAGMVVACMLSAVAMGGCSWWLIGLQKYKNEIYGPWDQARPVIISRRYWDDV